MSLKEKLTNLFQEKKRTDEMTETRKLHEKNLQLQYEKEYLTECEQLGDLAKKKVLPLFEEIGTQISKTARVLPPPTMVGQVGAVGVPEEGFYDVTYSNGPFLVIEYKDQKGIMRREKKLFRSPPTFADWVRPHSVVKLDLTEEITQRIGGDILDLTEGTVLTLEAVVTNIHKPTVNIIKNNGYIKRVYAKVEMQKEVALENLLLSSFEDLYFSK